MTRARGAVAALCAALLLEVFASVEVARSAWEAAAVAQTVVVQLLSSVILLLIWPRN